ncbi:MAG: 30S ribosomal protein S4 [Firmicutes bacterium]|nr:30S ribosomal protein S4 [Bacillota bacterium]
MARYTDAVCRLCRREGMKLYLKGDRCYTEKCGITRRPAAPGQHGTGRKKPTEYGIQLREKQKAKRIYGVMEKQFEKYFDIAESMKGGITGENLLQILERRLDNVIYRLGFASSRAQARQYVRHGHVTINGKKVDIPSFLVDIGQNIAIKGKSASEIDFFKSLKEGTGRAVVQWLQVDYEKLEGNIVALPSRQDIDYEIQEHLIVELYSR